MKYLFVLFMASLLAACGGGGGSAGTTSGGSSGSGSNATLVVTLADSSGTALPTPHTLKAGLFYLAQAQALDSSGKPIANQVITFSTDSTLVTLAAPTALTDANGLASVKMTPLSVAGAGSVAATMTYNTTAITGTPASYQVTPSAVTGTPTLALVLTDASGNTLATPRTFYTGSTYKARVTVLDATSAPVSNQVVQFTADSTLAKISPSSALTDSNGVATVQIVPLTTTGAGSVQASTVVNGTTYSSPGVSFQVASASIPAAMTFVPQTATTANPTPGIIVVSYASNGNKLLTATFQLNNSQGVGISGQSIKLSLNAQSLSAGVAFLVNGVSASGVQTLVTDQDGLVSINVTSGTLPTPILVTATLASNSAITASSYGLAVTNGRPTQLRSSIAASTLSLEGGGNGSVTQGAQSTVTVILTDRMGNPIPVGTVVNLIASYGQIQGSCVVAIVNSASQCSAVWTSVAARPSNGWFTVLAYLDGEEDFIDANGNNQYDSGETFYDVGQAYMPKNAKASAYDVTLDQPIAGGMTGTSACAVTNSTVIGYQIPNTCDGIWSGSIRVRLGLTMNWSSSALVLTNPGTNSYTAASINVADDLGNAAPTGTKLTASLACQDKSSPPVNTTVPVTLSQTVTPNAVSSLTVTASYASISDSSFATCSLNFSATTPGGAATTRTFPIK